MLKSICIHVCVHSLQKLVDMEWQNNEDEGGQDKTFQYFQYTNHWREVDTAAVTLGTSNCNASMTYKTLMQKIVLEPSEKWHGMKSHRKSSGIFLQFTPTKWQVKKIW